MNRLYPAVRADLSECSYIEASSVLRRRDDLPLHLICTKESVSEEFRMWLWDNHRVTMITYVPKEILKHDNSWALHGYRNVFIQEGF